MLQERSKMPKDEQLLKSKKITDTITSLEEWKKADTVFTYIDMGAEVKTKDLIRLAWSEGKRVCVPIAKKNRLMYFVEITDFENLKKTKLGVSEPDLTQDFEVVPKKDDLFIVPGSVFDESKNRCGYGGGFYDTYGEKYGLDNTVGVCYDFQLLKSIPVEEFDRKLKMIVTEKRIVK